jgi:hypothetical protein
MKPIAKYGLGLSIALVGAYSLWIVLPAVVVKITCSTERVREISLSNLRFEPEDTSCDVLAKDEAIRVYVRDTVLDKGWFFAKWRNERTLLLRYDPGVPDNAIPSITRPNQSTILISIPEVSSIEYQSSYWENTSINYEIGKVDYPSSPK